MTDKILFSENIAKDLSELLETYSEDKIFFIVDENTYIHCYPIVQRALKSSYVIQIRAGEKSKTVETANFLWNFLTNHNADRKSIIVNLGGGMITDLGGFVATTYKRGIEFINVPTSLLAMVDASVGGKNGVNLGSYKNHVGTFNEPKKVLISSVFLKTLPKRQMLSGFAEIIKHALLKSEKVWQKIKAINPEEPDLDYMQIIIKESVKIKLDIVRADPQELGIREALNFGHTIGHALETFLLSTGVDIVHGEAVAVGLIMELFLSNQKYTFPLEKLFEVVEYLATYFPSFKIQYSDYEKVYEIMKHDKKNKNNQIIFTLLEAVGKIHTSQVCEKKSVFEAFNFYFQVKK